MINKVLGAILRVILTRMSKGRLPKIDGTITLPGLSAPVRVIRDKWGIPHIYASNDNDLFYAQGFVTAQDRFWQMELNRRTANGKLSEVFGEIAFDTDRVSRTFGFARLGQEDWNNADEELKAIFQAYSDGVNAFLEQGKLPVEFSLMRYKPEPWDPLDSAAFSRVMVWQLSHAWYGEIVRAKLVEAVGAERAAELEIHHPEKNPITLPKGIEFNKITAEGVLKQATGPFLDRGKGSNTWTMSGKKSVTGKPFLCNDMHLTLMMPSLWYECHLIAGDYNVTGVTLPGVPLVMVGHNANIAWGMTLSFMDIEDLFIEKMNPDNLHQYEYRGEWIDAEVIEEIIAVKGRVDPHVEEILITRHGPVISDAIAYTKERLADCSMALRSNKAFKGWLLLNKASNWDEFVEAMSCLDAPALNVSYADTAGNTGYWVSGKVPVRGKGDGSIPAPGWTGEYDWTGFIPFEEMPHALNPEEGFLVNTNHKIVPEGYKHFLGNIWMNGYRARRIVDVFGSKKLGINDFKRLQVDFHSIPGLEFVERLQHFNSVDPHVQIALQLLRTWDGQLTPESAGGTVYEVVRYMLVRKILEPALGKDLTDVFMGKGFHELLYHSHEFHGHDTVVMLRLLDTPDSWWIQQAGGRAKLLEDSLRDATRWLQKELGKDPSKWQWGKLHRVNFPHAMGLQKPLDRVFNRGPYPIGGDNDTVCQTAFHPHDMYDAKAWAPSHRQIIDLGDLSNSLMIYAPGQSGHLGSKHYDDLIDIWQKGDYHPMLWTREQIEANAEGKLELRPLKS